jgi:uncharacterized protein YbjT (DUF2867 family)
VALSVVGTDRLPESGYLRAKMAQERLIKASGIPYTILRSAQFFEFMGQVADSFNDGTTVRVPPALVQPIFSDDVVTVMADLVLGVPVNDTLEVAGPERLRFDELIRRVLVNKNDAREVTTDVHARYFGTELNDQSPSACKHRPSTRHDALRKLAHSLHVTGMIHVACRARVSRRHAR